MLFVMLFHAFFFFFKGQGLCFLLPSSSPRGSLLIFLKFLVLSPSLTCKVKLLWFLKPNVMWLIFLVGVLHAWGAWCAWCGVCSTLLSVPLAFPALSRTVLWVCMAPNKSLSFLPSLMWPFLYTYLWGVCWWQSFGCFLGYIILMLVLSSVSVGWCEPRILLCHLPQKSFFCLQF